MATSTRPSRARKSEASEPASAPASAAALTRDQLIHAYRVMYMSRKLDDKEIQL